MYSDSEYPRSAFFASSSVRDPSCTSPSMGDLPKALGMMMASSEVSDMKSPGAKRDELRPESWTRLMVAVMRLPVGPDPGILPGSGP